MNIIKRKAFYFIVFIVFLGVPLFSFGYSVEEMKERVENLDHVVAGLKEVVAEYGEDSIEEYEEVMKGLKEVSFEIEKIASRIYEIEEKRAPQVDDVKENIRDAFLGDGSTVCSFRDYFSGEEIEIHFSSGNMAMTYEEFYLVIKGETVYMWDEENIYEEESIKFEIGNAPVPPRSKEGLIEEITKEPDFRCFEKEPNQELFKIPEEIEFIEITEDDFPLEVLSEEEIIE